MNRWGNIKLVTALVVVSGLALCSSFAAETNTIPPSFKDNQL
jgi:hypothetical protein